MENLPDSSPQIVQPSSSAAPVPVDGNQLGATTTEQRPKPSPIINFAGVIFLILFLLSRTIAIGTPDFLIALIPIVAIIFLIFAWVVQLRYIRGNRSPKVYKLQVTLAIATTVLPALGIIVGDLQGAATFDGDVGGSYGMLFSVPVIVAILIFVFHSGNILLILKATIAPVLRILGMILYGILWLLLATVMYFAYALAYSLHDPSTE